MHKGLERTARFCLAVLLIATAVMKLLAVTHVLIADRSHEGLYFALAMLELVIALGLLRARWSHSAALLCAGGFTGAALVNLWWIATVGADSICGCMGSWRLSRGHSLAMQGLVVLLAGSVLALGSGGSSGRSTADLSPAKE